MRFEAGENEAGRRLDRVLKKLLAGAPLSFIYRAIRKDVKVNGKRAACETLLAAGDVVEILLPEGQLAGLMPERRAEAPVSRKQFVVVYEDGNILVVDKPFGLLTHGDAVEKKNTLANQVTGYLADTGAWRPGGTNMFTPAPANRLDRNTTGLVTFGKTLPAARDLALMLGGGEGGGEYVEKGYLAVVAGRLKAPMTLKARMVRDGDRNITKVLDGDTGVGRPMVTEVKPLAEGNGFTLVEARLLTGRTHQIRAQLAGAGFPVIGDRKYGDAETNRMAVKRFGLTAQLLHAYRLKVVAGTGSLLYLMGRTFLAAPPVRFTGIAEALGCDMKMKL